MPGMGSVIDARGGVDTGGFAAPASCPQCGKAVAFGQLTCPVCQALVFRDTLKQLAGRAMPLEADNPQAAAMVWQQCLDLLPPDSQQHQLIAARIGSLAGGWHEPAKAPPPPPGIGAFPLSYAAPRPRAGSESTFMAVGKTVGSMLLSMGVYWALFQSWPFAVGFVLLILVHEMGHVLAMRYYGLNASAPVFIPFVGALINLRESPANAKVEAVVGIGGPIAGTLAALFCFAIYHLVPLDPSMHSLFLELACIGFLLNLFNLLPVPPLDGGRVTAAVSPRIWIVGLLAAAGLIGWEIVQRHIPILLAAILFFGFPRIKATLKRRNQDDPYYRISRRASWTIGSLYVGLIGLLSVLFFSNGGLRFIGL